jgi:predicted DCC family thiol-disulfide oxidoreductase YuxK
MTMSAPETIDAAQVGSPGDTVNSEAGSSVDLAVASRPILFFDGVCGLCNWSVDFVLAHERRQQILFSPLQGETAASHLGIQPGDDFSSVVLLEHGARLEQSDAVARLLTLMGGGWSILGTMLRLIPRPIRNFGYRLVASNRFRLFGRKAACRLPTPAERTRFLP